MTGTPSDVAVVVVTYNSARLLPDLVASLPAGMGDLRWDLVVVDNASSDGSDAVARALHADVTVVQTGRNAGYAAAINAGAAVVPDARAVLVLNPDVRLLPGCVPALLTALEVPGTGIAVPLLLDARGVRIDSMRRRPTELRLLADALLGAGRAGRISTWGEVVTDEDAYTVETVTDWAEGSTLLISTECLRGSGPWDESFFLYSEETEFALRAGDRGFATRFTPSARAVHLEGGSNSSPALWALLTTNRVRLHGRRHGWLRGAVFWALLLLRETSRALLGKSTSRAAARALVDPRRLRELPGPHLLRGPLPDRPAPGATP